MEGTAKEDAVNRSDDRSPIGGDGRQSQSGDLDGWVQWSSSGCWPVEDDPFGAAVERGCDF